MHICTLILSCTCSITWTLFHFNLSWLYRNKDFLILRLGCLQHGRISCYSGEHNFMYTFYQWLYMSACGNSGCACTGWTIVHISIHPGLQPSVLSMPVCGGCADIKGFACYTHRPHYKKILFIKHEQYIFLYFSAH